MTDPNTSTDESSSEDQDTSWKWTKNVTLSPDETLSADKLGRATYAEFLTSYLNSAGEREGGYVMNLNAEWGAGKTWFLKRWCYELQDSHPVAYIDAWKNDFSDDPLITVIAGVLEALKKNPNVQWIEREQRLFEWLWKIAKGAAKPADVYVKSQGIDGAGLLTALMDLHTEKGQGLEQSRKEISRWLVDVTEGPNRGNFKAPMYVFIDELDRCRPTYAIELLETVKHLFEIRGIVFVIATNTDQLQHSIKAVYGEGFDANRYLYRFFQRSYSLKQPAMTTFISTHDCFERLSSNLQETGNGNVRIEQDDLAEFLSEVSERFGFDLRTTGQWLDQLDAAYASVKDQNRFFWGLTMLMIAMKLSNPELYDRLSGKLSERDQDDKQRYHSFLRKVPANKNPDNTKLLNLTVTTKHLPKRNKISDSMATLKPGFPEVIHTKDSVDPNWIDQLQKIANEKGLNIEHYRSLNDPEGGSYSCGFFVACHYFVSQKGATLEGYRDLVDMAFALQ